MNREEIQRVLKGISHTGYTTELERGEAIICIENLFKENQKLKETDRNNTGALVLLNEENKKLKECYCNRTDCSGRIKGNKKYLSVAQERDLYKSVIKEAIKELDDPFENENGDASWYEIAETYKGQINIALKELRKYKENK